jgi:hypothetical protein
MLIAVVAALVAGTAWWLSAHRLSAEEHLLVGTWRRQVSGGGMTYTVTFSADRRWTEWLESAGGRADGHECRWSVRDGELVIDPERYALRRVLRPLAPLLGLKILPPLRAAVEVAPEQIVITGPNGPRLVYTRAPVD